ncbi:DUF5341 domain-containing protein [Mycolicibacterium sp. OfavD-34-C]|uniref:DUF5341 domain-containing protein n=1 Tax=Mycolicibacterium sp. OfavD-34-C TaxID=2917746 RepID=UPI001EF6B74A|nr:DUF5341 domain-containing protein [Mycolicibacterium sp. OfavD-34-C]MCG7582041.1 DUF5341 domain-containing protein [Mycolicibacterium sp. OfavD-34-C]
MPVLHFSTPLGTGYAIALTRTDLTELRDTVNNVLEATPGDIDAWLDGGGAAVLHAGGGAPGQEPRSDRPAAELITHPR